MRGEICTARCACDPVKSRLNSPAMEPTDLAWLGLAGSLL